MSRRKRRILVGEIGCGAALILICVIAWILIELDVLPDSAEQEQTRAAMAAMTRAVITPSATSTITDTPVPSATATITNTPVPSATATITDTPIPSNTPAPTATLRPEDIVRQIIDDIIMTEIIEIQVNDYGPAVVASWMMIDSWGDLVNYTNHEMVDVACGLREIGLFAGWNYQFTAKVNLVDQYGNHLVGDGVVTRLLPEAIERINCDETILVNLEVVAEYYEVHPALRG